MTKLSPKRLASIREDDKEDCHFESSVRPILEHIDALETENAKLRECLGQFVLTHEHQPNLPHTRAKGDSYGWCGICLTTVTWGEDPAREALKE